MKRSELKEVIRQAMLDEITVVDKDTKPQDLPKEDPKTVASAINTAKNTQMPVNIAEDRFMDAALEDLGQVVKNIAHTAGISLDEAGELAINHIQDMLSEELNEAPYSMTNKVLPQDYDRITGKINSGLVEMGHWLEQNYEGNALPELQSIQDAYTEFDNKIAHGDEEEYEGGDLGVPGDNALGLEEAVKRADAIIAGYKK
jgi:hypothetical protein